MLSWNVNLIQGHDTWVRHYIIDAVGNRPSRWSSVSLVALQLRTSTTVHGEYAIQRQTCLATCKDAPSFCFHLAHRCHLKGLQTP